MNVLSDAERIARLRLFRSESIGPVTFYKMLGRFGSAVKALEAIPLMAQRSAKKKTIRIMSVQEASDELKMLQSYGGKMIIFGDADYPEWLTTIDDAPPVLSIIGDAKYLSQSSIAIVGARNASANGKRFAAILAETLGQKGQVIVSGLARGIDTCAHRASLATGTIAVLAGGIDQIYPNENKELYAQIAEQGCVVSEMAFGTAPTAHLFPRRNRIVSGLSKGVVIVEASLKSGSLITARLASEQGREVFAVPGFPGDPRAEGPNSLIQNGAKLVQNADDILEEVMAMKQKAILPQTNLFEGIAEDYKAFNEDMDDIELSTSGYDIVLQNLSQTPTEVDELCRSCQISIRDIQTVLLELEITGEIHRHPGNRVSKAA